MSQAGIISTSSGPVPPTVPTSFVTDVNSPAIPIANVLNVLGNDTTVNNGNGIRTDGSSGSNTLTVQLTNRTSVSSTTSDGAGQTQTVTIFTPTASSGITFTVSVIGYDSANNEVCGGELIGIARSSGVGTVVVVGTNDTFDECDAGLIAVDWDIITNGTLIQIQFIGVAGRTINWNAVFTYNQTL